MTLFSGAALNAVAAKTLAENPFPPGKKLAIISTVDASGFRTVFSVKAGAAVKVNAILDRSTEGVWSSGVQAVVFL